ncbi:MAG: 2-oxoadipate dioxygenase/decarboxylase family protein [Planctomycetota bacterium]
MTTFAAGSALASKIEMQNRLFGALSAMFGKEVPLYDRSLLVNEACNRTVCGLLSRLHAGFAMSDEVLARTSGERHGAIRIGRPDEYRWIGRLFACFAMEPHNFYDMTNVGSKSQPIIATAFRSTLRPEHRVFSSVLMTDYFDPATRARIEELLAKRTVFSDRAKALIEKCEQQGGLGQADGDALIKECTDRIFKWTGKARDHALYQELSAAGFKIAADIACFQSHHLNHLTPNTFCIDLYTAAMKRCMGEVDAAWFEARATTVLSRLMAQADRDFMKLHFKHVPLEEIARYGAGTVTPAEVAEAAAALTRRFTQPEFALAAMKHAGFKDFTEGPSEDTPVLLRQDAYKALTEPVEFTENDGTVVNATHTARFGEIEERFYACTPKGRAMYDACLSEADAAREQDPALPKRDMAAYEALYGRPFAPFPKSLQGLIRAGLVYARYAPTPKGVAAKGAFATLDLLDLAAQGFVEYEGLRYEDFLPVSAAGIFASNLQQYGTKSTAAVKPTYTQQQLEEILGRRIIDSTVVYAGVEAESKLDTYAGLGVIERVPAPERAALDASVAAYRAMCGTACGTACGAM